MCCRSSRLHELRSLSRYGYFVGCNNLGEFPFPTYKIYYEGAKWQPKCGMGSVTRARLASPIVPPGTAGGTPFRGHAQQTRGRTIKGQGSTRGSASTCVCSVSGEGCNLHS